MSPLTSVELNYLVFRYLHESGFTHSSFVLGYEAGVNKCTIDGNLVPPSALITFVQKGLQYLAMEADLSNDEADVEDDDFSFLEPLDLITKDVNELRQIIKEKRKNLQKDRDIDKEKVKQKDESERDKDKENERERVRNRVKYRHDRGKEIVKDRESKGKRKK